MKSSRKAFAFAIIIVLLLQVLPPVFAALEIERPYRSIGNINQENCNGNADKNGSLAVGAMLTGYEAPSGDYGDADCVHVNVSMMANTRKLSYAVGQVPYQWIDECDLVPGEVVTFSNVGEDWGRWLNLSAFWTGYYNDFREDFRFKFYNAKYRSIHGSESSCIWICSNGFISFDMSNHTSGESAKPPNGADPNAFIAPLWTHLIVDSQASIVAGPYIVNGAQQKLKFVVTWKNALVKNTQTRITFQLVLEEFTPDDEITCPDNGMIYFSYRQVGSVPTGSSFVYGVENHDGSQGTGDQLSLSVMGGLNGTTLRFTPQGDCHWIRNLYLEFEDSCPSTRCSIPNDVNWIRGHNVRTTPEARPNSDTSLYRLIVGTANTLVGAGGYALLSSGVIELSVSPITIPVGIVLAAWGFYDYFTRGQYSNVWSSDLFDYHNTTAPRAYIKVPVNQTWTQDAALDVVFHWVLDDANRDQPHSLTIKSTVEYGYATYAWNLSTTVNLKMDPDSGGDSFDTAKQVGQGAYSWLYIDDPHDRNDCYWIQVPYEYRLCVTVTPTLPNDTKYDLYLYNSSRICVSKSENPAGQPQTVSGDQLLPPWDIWYIKVNATNGGFGFYNMSTSLQQIRALTIYACAGGTTDPPPGMYGCRVGYFYKVSVNSTLPNYWFDHWILDGNPDYSGSTIYVYMDSDHTLRPVFLYSDYSGGDDHTGPPGCPTLFVYNGSGYVDYGVINIHDSTGQDVNRTVSVSKDDVGVSRHMASFVLREGWVGLNFSESFIDQVQLYAVDSHEHLLPCPLISATHIRLGNVWPQLLLNDNWRVQTLLLETIDLKFLTPYPSNWIKSYVFTIDGCNQYKR